MRFDRFEVTDGGDLLRDGAPLHFQPQPMKVLALLVARAGELVTRDELRQHVWGDDTFVDFDQSLNWCVRRIREVLGDDATSPRFIQTVPRRGYRFIAQPLAEVAPQAQPQPRRVRPRRMWAAAIVLALLAGSFALPSRRPTVLVLPFDDLGGANRADAVATAEVIHSLATSRVGVIDPLTAAKFRKTNECIVVLGKQLDAEYVLLGNVRRAGPRLRVTAQLFRVADNRQAWAGEQELAPGADATPVYARMAREVAQLIENS